MGDSKHKCLSVAGWSQMEETGFPPGYIKGTTDMKCRHEIIPIFHIRSVLCGKWFTLLCGSIPGFWAIMRFSKQPKQLPSGSYSITEQAKDWGCLEEKMEPLGIFSLDCGALIETRPISSAKESWASTVVFWINFSFATQSSKEYEMLLSVHKHLAFSS